MKKYILILFLLVLSLCAVTCSASAGLNPDFRNIQLSPADGSVYSNGNISWSCSGTLALDEYFMSWIVEVATNTCYQGLSVELYELVEVPGAFTTNGYTSQLDEQYVQSIYNTSYNNIAEVDFSAGGTLQLDSGNYRIKIVATLDEVHSQPYTKVVASHDFTVNQPVTPPPAPPAPQTATIIINHLSDDGRYLGSFTMTANVGEHKGIYANAYEYPNYDLVSANPVNLYVQSGTNTVTFIYRERTAQNNPPTDRPMGNDEYSLSNYPVYRVDPTQEPWEYCYLYSAPNDNTGRNMGRYNKGTEVKVIEYYGGGHGKFNYCFVLTQDNQKGYMHDYALQPVSGNIQEYTGTYAQANVPEYVVNPSKKPWDYCYLYSIPNDTDGRNLGTYYKGDVVKVIEYNGGRYNGDNYCFVITRDGKTGYMHDYALQPY